MKRDEFLKIAGMSVGSLALTSFDIPYKDKRGLYSFPQLVGNVSQTEAVLQTRLTDSNHLSFKQIKTIDQLLESDIKGVEGVARFEVSEDENFNHFTKSSWKEAGPETDFIMKHKIQHLKPGTSYYMRVRFGRDKKNTRTGPVNRFSTLIDEKEEQPFSFIVQSCMSLAFFLLGRGGKLGATPEALKKWEKEEAWKRPATGKDRDLGYPALETLAHLNPSFWVLTGDNVYYDHPSSDQFRAKTKEEMRAKWHRQFSTPRINEAFSKVPTYWMVDDHDFRYNDSDNRENDKPPSAELAKYVFHEQLPMNDFENGAEDGLYRTRKVSKHLQIWTMNGRFFRDPTNSQDGPDKSMFGKEQLEWLKKTLLESKATFKVIILGNQIIGPAGGGYKGDSHASPAGFRYERDQLFNWMMRHDFVNKNVYFITGNAHTRFHSISPVGFEEFATGTITSQNVSGGRTLPGDPHGSDPLGLIKQPYLQKNQIGGFLKVDIVPPKNDFPALIKFISMDEKGNIENVTTRTPK